MCNIMPNEDQYEERICELEAEIGRLRSVSNLAKWNVRIHELEIENQCFREEIAIYREALQRMIGAPRMCDSAEFPRYIAKDALRNGIKIRTKYKTETNNE